MNLGQICYVCGARNFYKEIPPRKIKGIIECWRKMGYVVSILCGGDINKCNKTAVANAGNCRHRPWYRDSVLLKPIVKSLADLKDIRHDALMFQRLAVMMDKSGADIIWERSASLHLAGLRIARRIGLPYVLEWKDHLTSYHITPFHYKATHIEETKLKEANYVIVESEFLRDNLSREGIDRDKIIVAHNAVDSEQFYGNENMRKQKRNALGIRDDEVLVGYLGSYAFYHDSVRLVLAADIVRRQNMNKIKILMVGEGKEYPQAHRIAGKRGLLNSILVMKPPVPQNEVPGILSALDIAVLPGSTDIICPIKIQEYMASELPTVVPDYPCNREVITDGVTGLLFEPKNEDSLADRISVLARDNQLRANLGKQARKKVIERFTWEKTWGAALTTICQRLAIR